MVILWLAAFAATAARRSKFKFDVPSGTCFDGVCFKKRDIYILNDAGLKQFAAAAGIGALVW